MADFLTPEARSKVMASIRSSKNKSTETKVAVLFRKRGIHGWRRNCKVTGRPDFVFFKNKVALFIDGCFWHGCELHCRRPKSKLIYWNKKIMRNIERDKEVSRQLRAMGWKVIRVWEHSLAKPTRFINQIKKATAV